MGVSVKNELSLTSKKRMRRIFGSTDNVVKIPNLIYVQRKSYSGFLQADCLSESRENKGLEAVFRSIFPVSDYEGVATIEYVKYTFDEPKYDVEECIQRGVNYAAPLRVTLRLIVWDIDEDAGLKEIKGIKEQDVYMGEIPLMTESGTFIINGAERVVVSQMHRSPGVFYTHDAGKTHSTGKYLYSSRIIPYRGSWIDFEFDVKDLLFFRIDRKRKIYITTLLRALGMSKDDILDEFYNKISYKKSGTIWHTEFKPSRFKGQKLEKDIVNAVDGQVMIAADTKITPRLVKKLEEGGSFEYPFDIKQLVSAYIAHDIIDPETGEIILESGDEITEDALDRIEEMGLEEIKVLDIDYVNVGPYIRNVMVLDKNHNKESALSDIYKVLRPGEPATPEAAEALFQSTFFEEGRYDLSEIGRMKINAKHGLDIDPLHTTLKKEDLIAIVKYLVKLKDGFGEVDDIDNLGNRRVRSVGELVENQFRLGLIRMERVIVERMGSVEIDTVMPHDLVNAKVLMSVIREFFGTSQLSQFMDQTNPLSEITHKRRLSALGPGGLTRERAGFEVRDVHPTHYGRICPIETPEGPNIGLINSLATYAKINRYGFIESPYRKVTDGKVTDEVEYLSAIEEGKYTVAQASAELNEDGSFIAEMINCRRSGEVMLARPEDVDYIAVSPKQLVSVAASLIPFLENDDANRALMGSNMQRQAVPLLQSDAPLVGTGMESVVAADSGATVIAKNSGIVNQVDANRIVIKSDNLGGAESGGVDIYTLVKFKKSNQNTCINQVPIVKVGERVNKGDIIADGSSTNLGDLALGRNVMVAFMTWNGYNFEDSIIISEKLVRDDAYTSIHIEEFEVIARDTRLGPEEITRDIPNVGEDGLRHLDEIGVVHVGADVKAGDILVGKVTPKTESPITPEEKLLRAIFGEKASDVRDSSLRVPPGAKGTVVGVRVFTRRGVEKDERAVALERLEIDKLSKDRQDELNIVEGYVFDTVRDLLLGKVLVKGPKQLKEGAVIDDELLKKIPKKQMLQLVIDNQVAMEEISKLHSFYDKSLDNLDAIFKRRVEKVQSGDDLPQGALKVVKIYVATKLKLQPGDKMAGRHGNKGVVSRIVPVEDMPFLEDGTPVDIILNPLGVPSRMNVGQILETHLGWASANLGMQIRDTLEQYEKNLDTSLVRERLLGIYSADNDEDYREHIQKMQDSQVLELANNLTKGVPFATPVFEGAKEENITEILKELSLKGSGQVSLIDGLTGEKFDRDVTVGYIYMLKLDHLVDDKIHARSIGPYSLVTQQPLGGKSHFGGQRFGEMECWALQAYGAAYTLQEMLTVKSDDVSGRIKMYESIVRGDTSFESGLPESFNVMVKELRSLCLNIELQENDN